MSKQNSVLPTTSHLDFTQLKVGHAYRFHIRPWVSPQGDVVAGIAKSRTFLGRLEIDGIQFIEVARFNGREHLIAEETLSGWIDLGVSQLPEVAQIAGSGK